MQSEHEFFWGGIFSNFNPINGDESLTSEKFFMFLKAAAFRDAQTLILISKSKTPREAKKLGRQVKGFDESKWNEIKFEAMMSAIRLKAQLDVNFVSALIQSKNKILVEASPVDKIWGIGFDEANALDNTDKWGQNLLGKALMQLRSEIATDFLKD